MSVTCKVILPHDLERNDTLGEKEWGHGEKRKAGARRQTENTLFA